MKKLIAVCLILCAGTSLFAFGFSLGLRAGAPYNTVYRADSTTFEVNGYIWGGTVSAVAVLDLFLFLSIQAEVGYSCRNGFFTAGAGASGVVESTWSFPAIEIPLMVKFRLPLGFALSAGPLLTIPVGKITHTVGSVNSKTSVKDAALNDLLWGLVVSADFELRLGKHHRMVIDARFAMDFTNFDEQKLLNYRRISFTPSLGYRYKF